MNNGGAGATITTQGTGIPNNDIAVPLVLAENLTLEVNQTTNQSTAGSLSIAAPISGPGGITKNGPGLLTFITGAKTYTGPTVLNAGRTRFVNSGQFTATSSFTINSGAQLVQTLDGSYTFGAGNLNLNGTGLPAFPGVLRPDRATAGRAITITNNVVLQSDSLIHVQSGAGFGDHSMTLAGQVSGPGALTLTGPGELSDGNLGRLVLSSPTPNTYAGGTVLNGGRLDVTGVAGLGSGPLTINANVQAVFAVPVVVNLSTSAPTTTGTLSGAILNNPNSTLAINTGGGQVYTVNQTADATFQGTIAGSGGLTKSGPALLNLPITSTYTGGTTVTAGTLQVNRLHENNPVSITGGTLKVRDSSPTLPLHPSGDNAFVSRPSSLAISGTGPLGTRVYAGTLDLGNNDLVIDYTDENASPAASVEDMVRSGYNFGSWDGTGIQSSTAQNDPNFALGVAENINLLEPFGDGTTGPLFFGQSVDETTVLVKFTHRVDLNLNGVIDSNDAFIFNLNYNEGAPATWMSGDVDYDGVYGSNDAFLFNLFYNENLASVPEPGSVMGLLAVAGMGVLRRRRVG